MFEELIEKATEVLNPRQLSSTAEAGSVAAAMLTAGESQIIKMVAINKRGNILPPCGRCREFISQLNDKNIETEVLINRNKAVKLIDLLPYDWRQAKLSEIES